MNITCYGGVNEIGGNKILVEEDETRIFLDFGTSMGYESDFFSEFLQPRTATGLRDRLEIGALPRISGIYRKDLLIPYGVEQLNSSLYHRVLTESSEYYNLEEITSFEEYQEKRGRSFVDGVFLSHAHLDHSGAIGFLHNSISLYCTPVTKILVEAIDKVTMFQSKAIESKTNQIGFTGGTSTFPQSPKIIHEDLKRNVVSMDHGETVTIGNLTVTCIHQDHSVPGACSFVVESTKNRLLYTGDIRFHGSYPLSIDDYVEKVGKVDVMICEGTRIDSDRVLTESAIQQKIMEQMQNTKGVVFVDFSWKDTTRYETIRKAASDAGRIFVINARLAYLLQQLGMYPKEDEGVRVFLKRKYSCLYSPGDYSKYKHEYGLSCDWGEGIDDTHYQQALTAKDIKQHPERYCMMLSYFDLGQIFDIANNNGKIPDSFFIKAVCAPFSDEMELDEERLINWLDMFAINYDIGEPKIPEHCTNHTCEKIRDQLDRAHVSGHASRPELTDLIKKIRPKTLIPVHTQHPEVFKEVVDSIDADVEVVLPVNGVSYQIK